MDPVRDAAEPTDESNIVLLDRPRGESRNPDVKPGEGKPSPVHEPAAKRTAEAPAAEAPAAAPPAKKRSGARRVLPVLLVAVLGGAGWYGYNWWINGRFIVSTDDAYVQADVSTLGVKVSGYVATVPVKDGDHVKAGDVVATLDDTDYRLALDAAKAKRNTQGATIARIQQQILAQDAQIDSAKAGISSAQAASVRALSAYDRAKALAQQNFGSKATLDQAIADRDQSAAAIVSAEAALTSAQANLTVIEAQKTEAEQVAKELDTAVNKAQSDLDATVIRAPSDGVIGNRAAQPGQYVAPGSRLMALVPLQSVYIAANYKETQLSDIRPGQKVEIEVDAVRSRTFEGTVESLAAASGSTFSLLPPENATGNFTKITQRLPVRIAVPADVAALDLLRPGLSVVTYIDTRTGPKD
ncbi:HlyD family secretion protein [Labrys wisconsinensis]|uniref:Membrane fusion protein (Multidrug efflux system) n=1 Tax=Labrys wisconsinensis TaxID=425677 RepID=A0ABU0J1W8_9HYPH|nr:HlyD family secretion protein [Labrys wisconsinensis]MDQ0467566.1 membrane fusion protein (multidrug efflux system) [Labrys wisconsinensis]